MISSFYVFKGVLLSFCFLLIARPIMWFYKIKAAKSEEELHKLYKFRHDVYKKDLNMSFMDEGEASNFEKQDVITDEIDKYPNTVNLYATRKGEIAGVVRVSFYNDYLDKDLWNKKYGVTDEMADNNGLIGEISFFLVNKKYRGTWLPIAILASLYFALSKQKLFPSLIFGYSMPGLVRRYESVSCYTYIKKFIYDNDGVAIPFVMAPYEPKIGNKNYNIPSSIIFDYLARMIMLIHRKSITPKMHEVLTKSYREDVPHISLHVNDEINQEKIIQEKKTKCSALFLFIIKYFDLHRHLIFEVEAGKKIIVSKTIDYDIYLVLEGEFSALYNEEEFFKLMPGDTIGESDHLHEELHRFYTIKSLTKGKLLLIHRNSIQKLNDSQSATFYKCLAKDIHRKLNHAIRTK